MPVEPERPITEPAEALREPATYGDTESVTHLETHISHVYLTDRYVYKLKKPVRFPFLDFSTLPQRREACHEEVRINRRLAPDVYLGVFHVGRDRHGHWRVGGEADVEDWVVKMHRLPEDDCMEQRIREKSVTANEIESLVHRLATFYKHLEPERPDDYVARYTAHVQDNFSQLTQPEYELDEQLVYRAHAAQLQLLRFEPELFEARVRDGHLVEGHGDLRPDHIYFTDPPVCIDGIEFSREFRVIDTADELSFLAISCELFGAPDCGEEVLKRCNAKLGDQPPDRLIDFYRCYRACVRAKVAALRIDQTTGSEQSAARRKAMSILKTVEPYAKRIGTPRVIVTRGLSGTGKSTLAKAVAGALAARWIATDRIRNTHREQLGIEEKSLYTRENRMRVYQRLFGEADELLRNGISVILDGTFQDPAVQQQAFELAKRYAAPILYVTCDCPTDVALQRIRHRLQASDSISDADAETHLAQRQEETPLDPQFPSIRVDSTHDLERMLEEVFAFWRDDSSR